MTSVQRGLSQTPFKSRLLFAITGDSGFTQLKLTNAIAANQSAVLQYDGTILNTTNADTFLGYINYGRAFSQGEVFRDLGKTLHLQTNGRVDYILSYVQQVQGPRAEGVPDNYDVNSTSAGNFWICTWASNIASGGIGVNVVRSG
jgi:hypothetical protein